MSEVQRLIWLPQADFAFLRQITHEREDRSSNPIVIKALKDILPRLEDSAIRDRVAAYATPEFVHERELKTIRLPDDLDRLVGQRAHELQLKRNSIIVVSIQLSLEEMRAEA